MLKNVHSKFSSNRVLFILFLFPGFYVLGNNKKPVPIGNYTGYLTFDFVREKLQHPKMGAYKYPLRRRRTPTLVVRLDETFSSFSDADYDDDDEWKRMQEGVDKMEKVLEAKSKTSHIVHAPFFPEVRYNDVAWR